MVPFQLKHDDDCLRSFRHLLCLQGTVFLGLSPFVWVSEAFCRKVLGERTGTQVDHGVEWGVREGASPPLSHGITPPPQVSLGSDGQAPSLGASPPLHHQEVDATFPQDPRLFWENGAPSGDLRWALQVWVKEYFPVLNLIALATHPIKTDLRPQRAHVTPSERN